MAECEVRCLTTSDILPNCSTPMFTQIRVTDMCMAMRLSHTLCLVVQDHVTKKCMFVKYRPCQFCGKIEVIMGTVGLVVVDGG